jgi:hypothetical protein
MNTITARSCALGAALFLGGCVTTGPIDPETGFLTEVPEQVAALAAPHQDLSAVELRRGDRCYWYRHDGPVETVMLPLRTRDGRTICAR